MALRDVTDRQAVLDAISEYDRIGREPFLTKYGFQQSRSYFVEHDGKHYDSKPIAAAAHGVQYGDPLPNNFSGGEATVARTLEALGFTVTRPEAGDRLPDWTRDELILALDLYLTTRGQIGYSQTTTQVIALSDELRGLSVFPAHVRDNPRFRNRSGVALKLHNFSAIDPQHAGTGMAHGARGDRAVWDEWAQRPNELHAVAVAIRQAASEPDTQAETGEEEEDSAEEGRLLYRKHRRYERNRGLVKSKKMDALRRTARLACEVCDFESSELYGESISVIDVHHIVPLHQIGESKTVLSDLALVCPTCHRVIHAHKSFITPAQLRLKRLTTLRV